MHGTCDSHSTFTGGMKESDDEECNMRGKLSSS